MGGAGKEHGVTFTSEVEDSKRRVGSGTREEGLALPQALGRRYREEEGEEE